MLCFLLRKKENSLLIKKWPQFMPDQMKEMLYSVIEKLSISSNTQLSHFTLRSQRNEK